MRRWIHQIEVMVDEIIPYLLIILALLILGQMFFSRALEPYHQAVALYDWFVIAIFALDLGFKYHRVRNIPKFLRLYWLEIIATLPVFMVLRVVEEAAKLGRLLKFQEELRQPQLVLHESMVIERESARILREAERFGELTRFQRWARIFARFPRFLRIAPFHERPSGKHHPREHRHHS